ncbi:MAG: alanine dehydrogenase [Marinilabiliales bacterium]|nr:MAG: alanine dehydrogenase [Marinilabiliales bacterium]
MHIGILKETKVPVDRRTALTPGKAVELMKQYPEFKITAQSSDIRCFDDDEYSASGIPVSKDLSDCDLLVGVKEVAVSCLIPGKTYLFFSHTAKKQSYNRKLLQEIVSNKITLVDYEYLSGNDNLRLVGFGRWAGMVGAYNGLRGLGLRNRLFDLKPAWRCHDMSEMMSELKKVTLPPVKILITGGGRVASGAMETLDQLGYDIVDPEEYMQGSFSKPVVCRLDPWHYVRRRDGEDFDLQHFFYYPEEYESVFYPYSTETDLFIPCHYWDPRSPVFLEKEDYLKPGFRISVIADVSCDIGKPIASTIRASAIDEPFYGYDPVKGIEDEPFDRKNITVMAVDNLPGELPRDASEEFSEKLVESVFPAFLNDRDGIIERATIVREGGLTRSFSYLEDFLAGRE